MKPDARTAREHATWEPDQSLHGSHCGIQGPHSLGYGRQGQCDCGRDALLAQVERLEQERERRVEALRQIKPLVTGDLPPLTPLPMTMRCVRIADIIDAALAREGDA